MSIQWQYAKNFSELPSGEAEKVEVLVEIAEQIDKLNATLSATLIVGHDRAKRGGTRR